MSAKIRPGVAMVLMGLAATLALAQQGSPPPAAPAGAPAAKPATPPPPPPARNRIAASVNGQDIPELSLYRLAREAPNDPVMRKEALNFLVENILIDQYLSQNKINVEAAEIEKRLAQMKDEAVKEKQEWKKILDMLFLTEEELRVQLTCALRWDKYAEQQATDKALRDLFDQNKTMFDGSQMMARHILVTGKADEATAKIVALKKQIEAKVAQELAKLPPNTSKFDQEKERTKSLEKAFAETAVKESQCPSKAEGGNLGWFPRNGAMVEPFARAAFALKPYEMSDTVATEFGYHLILGIDSKPGKEVKFEDMRPIVREVFFERLRDTLVSSLKPRAQIVIHNPPQVKN